MSKAVGLAVAGCVVVLIGIGVVLSRGDETTYKLRFANAGQLVKGNDVQVGGRRIGSIRTIRLTDDNEAEIEIAVTDEFAPLHEGTTATIRATSLSGVANRYIALAPGRNDAPALPEGTVLQQDRTTTAVDLDQLFATFDAKTRKGLQDVLRGSATQYAGRGAQANRGAEYLGPALSSTQRLAAELTRDDGALQDFLVTSSKTVTALAARKDDLTGLVDGAARTSRAVASENDALSRGLDALPGTLRRTTATFADLRAALPDLDALVDASRPATRDLAPFLRELRPLAASARPALADLRGLVRTAGDANDLTDLLRRTPGLADVATPSLRNQVKALDETTPVLQFARPYTPDLLGFIRGYGQSASNYDANGHFVRVSPTFNAFRPNADGTVLEPQDATKRLDAMSFGHLTRCPGGAGGVEPYKPDGLDCGS